VELQRPPLERGKVVPNTREVIFLIPLANPKREREREREREYFKPLRKMHLTP
jgi:hypothetical protein